MLNRTRSFLRSVRFRLILTFIFLTGFPLVLAGTVVAVRTYASLEQQSLLYLQEVANRVGVQISELLEGEAHQLQLVSEISALAVLDKAAQEEILANLLFHQRNLQEIAFVDEFGDEQIRLSRTAIVLPGQLRNLAGQEPFQIPFTSGQAYFSSVQFDEDLQEPLVTVGFPLTNEQTGAIVAVLVGQLRFKSVWDLLAATALPEGSDVYVTSGDGQVIAHRNPAVVLQGCRHDLPPQDGRARGLNGEEVILTRTALTLGQQELLVVTEQSLAVALRPATDNLRITLVVTAIALLIAALLGYLFTRQIVRPIEVMAGAARRLARGEFPQPVAATRQDEIGQLALAFNQMSRQLRQTLDELRAEVQVRRQAEASLSAHTAELERTIKQLRNAQEQLLRQERLAVLGQLAGSVGHELRNPLGVIANALYYLRSLLLEMDGTAAQYLELIAQRVQEADKIVADLLNLSRTQPVQQDETSAQALIDAALARTAPAESVDVRVDVAAELPTLFVDAQQMGQVLTNLITNACQAMDDEGVLQISAHLRPAAQPAESAVAIAISDSGPGIDEEVLPKIFDPLFTTKPGGIGLGLAICRNLIEVNRGKLAVACEIGSGCTFTVILPVDRAG